MRSIVMLIALAAAMPLQAGDKAASKVVAFNASVRVEVDPAGKPTRVEAPADLPEAIRGFIEKRVASWQYEPAKVGDMPQAAVTYVAVNACAVPMAGEYRLGVDFDGNGVRYSGDQRIPPPMYPPEAQMRGTEAEFVLILGIETDGHAKLDQVEHASFSSRKGSGEFEPALRRWAKTLRFDPELVAGKPVRGQVRMPVSFILSDTRNRQELLDELQAKAKASRECQIASGEEELKPVAMNPAVTVMPVPAG
jgi:TonB family protein